MSAAATTYDYNLDNILLLPPTAFLRRALLRMVIEDLAAIMRMTKADITTSTSSKQ
jgi:hypothetical protein